MRGQLTRTLIQEHSVSTVASELMPREAVLPVKAVLLAQLMSISVLTRCVCHVGLAHTPWPVQQSAPRVLAVKQISTLRRQRLVRSALQGSIQAVAQQIALLVNLEGRIWTYQLQHHVCYVTRDITRTNLRLRAQPVPKGTQTSTLTRLHRVSAAKTVSLLQSGSRRARRASLAKQIWITIQRQAALRVTLGRIVVVMAQNVSNVQVVGPTQTTTPRPHVCNAVSAAS
eukprot:SAG11_NODE_9553_length_901_cov_0.889027_1_plen_227_part_01